MGNTTNMNENPRINQTLRILHTDGRIMTHSIQLRIYHAADDANKFLESYRKSDVTVAAAKLAGFPNFQWMGQVNADQYEALTLAETTNEAWQRASELYSGGHQ